MSNIQRYLPSISGIMIHTARFYLRPLVLQDVSNKYLDWFGDVDVMRYIEASSNRLDRSNLEDYVRYHINRRDTLFLGIFTKDAVHIGNIKYQPIDLQTRIATMGILVGEKEWRGRGVASEVIKSSAEWLKTKYKIMQIKLSVDPQNQAALNAYLKSGFKQYDFHEHIDRPNRPIILTLNI